MAAVLADELTLLLPQAASVSIAANGMGSSVLRNMFDWLQNRLCRAATPSIYEGIFAGILLEKLRMVLLHQATKLRALNSLPIKVSGRINNVGSQSPFVVITSAVIKLTTTFFRLKLLLLALALDGRFAHLARVIGFILFLNISPAVFCDGFAPLLR
ncbi:hypothetical protein [Paraburkholderia fungorum]|uniref:hypothetical protein n=1 Tax=Paraburkholderia fungorum TaxID=134537 RepID=UPI0014962266|nr:hypothetical protein [Paraburkholderia fungorum]